MMTDEEKNRKLSDLVDIINKNYEDVDLLNALGKRRLPDRDRIIVIIKAIRRLMFPGYFGQVAFEKTTSHYFAG
jgi:serine O-acetyltransferase